MARSGLGRGLGNLLSEPAGRGISMPGPGVNRLIRLVPEGKAVPAPELPSTPVHSTRHRWVRGVIPGLCVADAALSLIALWLGGFSSMAGRPEALCVGGGLVVIAGFLGLLAAGVLEEG